MIRPALRTDSVKEYYFAGKLKQIARRNAEGADIISLGIGGPDMPPPAEVVESLKEDASRGDAHSYQPFAGLPALRSAWSDWYNRHYGVNVDPDREILPLMGSKEGIMHISMAFLNPGDKVLIPNPGYPAYTSASRLAGAEVVAYDLSAETGWQPDFDALEKMDLGGVKLMWANYPNMPTGATPSEGLFERFVDFGRRHDIVICHDNPYSFILNDRPLSIMSTPGALDIAIELNSLSKSHNMAGWRMGAVIAREEFIQWISKVKSNVDSGQFRPAMIGAIKALEVDDRWYNDLNAEYRRRRDVAERIMTALKTDFDPDQKGLFLWGRIPDEEKSAEEFADRILDKARVFVTPGFIFGSGGDRYIRISLCAPVDRLEAALSRISESNI